MAIEDIPVRDGDTGAVQLVKLRSYLKDSDNSAYTFPDSLLIALLVGGSSVEVWKQLKSLPTASVPWSFELSYPISHVSTIRSLTGDTDILSIKYTDYELTQFLNVIPLRYIVSLVKLSRSSSTYPADLQDPIRIMRTLLDDVSGAKYTDGDLRDRMFGTLKNPFMSVISIIGEGQSTTAASSITSGSAKLASIDGVSFAADSSETSMLSDDFSRVYEAMGNSAYVKESIFGWVVDGESVLASDTGGGWYAVS